MFLIEPFIWMFKSNEFISHFLRLFSLLFIVWIPTFIIYFFLFNSNGLIPQEYVVWLKLSFILILMIPFLCLAGYFWTVTDGIIYRDSDVVANNIYNNSVKVINIINLPEWDIKKFLWRGIASIIATVIMLIPFILLVGVSYSRVAEAANYWMWDSSQTSLFINSIAIFAAIFIPGLLWNYARRDSILAALNIPKAVYLMGTYTLRYIRSVLVFLGMSYVNYFIVNQFLNHVGFSIKSSGGYLIYSVSSGCNVVLNIILLVIGLYLISLYFLYVYAFILGTLTPSNEN